MIPEWPAAQSDTQACCLLCKKKAPSSDFTRRTLQKIREFAHWIIISDQISKSPGLLQKIDPRIKVIGLIGLLLVITTACRLDILLGIYALTLGIFLCSKIPLARFITRTWVFIPLFSAIMALPALLNIVTPGDAVWTLIRFREPFTWGWWQFPDSIAITRQGLITASILVLRVANAVSWSVLIVLATPWEKLLGALQIFRVPQSLIMTIGVMVRYLHLLFREMEESQLAIQSRTIHALGTRTGQRVVTAHIGVLLQKSLKLGENVYQAMCARGYTGKIRMSDTR